MKPDSGCILAIVFHQHCAVWTNDSDIPFERLIDVDPTLRTSASVWSSVILLFSVLERSLSNALDVRGCP
jgi:hypothetical protein